AVRGGFVVAEFAFPVAAVGPGVAALAAALAGGPPALVHVAATEPEGAFAVRQPALDVALVAVAVRIDDGAFAVGHVARPVAVVALAVGPDELAFAFLQAAHQRALELLAVAPDDFPGTRHDAGFRVDGEVADHGLVAH